MIAINIKHRFKKCVVGLTTDNGYTFGEDYLIRNSDGLHITIDDMYDPDTAETFSHLLKYINGRDIRYPVFDPEYFTIGDMFFETTNMDVMVLDKYTPDTLYFKSYYKNRCIHNCQYDIYEYITKFAFENWRCAFNIPADGSLSYDGIFKMKNMKNEDLIINRDIFDLDFLSNNYVVFRKEGHMYIADLNTSTIGKLSLKQMNSPGITYEMRRFDIDKFDVLLFTDYMTIRDCKDDLIRKLDIMSWENCLSSWMIFEDNRNNIFYRKCGNSELMKPYVDCKKLHDNKCVRLQLKNIRAMYCSDMNGMTSIDTFNCDIINEFIRNNHYQSINKED